MDTFYLQASQHYPQFSLDDITYAINLAITHPDVKNNPYKLMLWHRLAGEMYQPHVKMSINALFHYKTALDYAHELEDIQQEVDICLKIARVYFGLNLTYKAYPYIQRCTRLCRDEKKSKGLAFVSGDLTNIGFLLEELGELTQANSVFAEAVKRNAFPNTLSQMLGYSAWGLSTNNLKQYAQAIKIYDQGIALAQKYGHEIWVGIMKGNQGMVYYQLGDEGQALELLMYDLQASIKFADKINTARTAMVLAKLKLKSGKTAEAKPYIELAEQYSKAHELPVNKLDLWAEYYRLKGDWQSAYEFKNKAKKTVDSLEKEEAKIEADRLKELLDFVAEEDAMLLQKNQLLQEKKALQSRVLWIIGVLAVGVALGLGYYFKVQDQQKRRLVELQQELSLSQAREISHLQKIQEQAEGLKAFQKIQARLERLQQEETDDPLLATLSNQNLLQEKDWKTFKRLFDEIHDGFIEKLSTHEAKFTQAEIRLLALSKLELGNFEIAESLGISIHGVKKGKQRLRKKLAEWPEDKNLIQILS